jgi:hypothetical protein
MPRIIKRIILIVIGAAILFFVVVGVVAHFIKAKDPPSTLEAPWVIQTHSRVYYAQEFSIQEGVQAIRGYWYSDGDRWIYSEESKSLPETIFGPIKVIRRSK